MQGGGPAIGTRIGAPPVVTVALNVPGAAHQFDQVITLVTETAPTTNPAGNDAGLAAMPSSGTPPRSYTATSNGSSTVHGSPFDLNWIEMATPPVAGWAAAVKV